MTLSEFAVPAVIIAVLSFVLQGAKAAVDLQMQWRMRRTALEQRQIARFVALCSLLDAMPMSEGERIVAKRRVAEIELKNALSDELVHVLFGST